MNSFLSVYFSKIYRQGLILFRTDLKATLFYIKIFQDQKNWRNTYTMETLQKITFNDNEITYPADVYINVNLKLTI